MSVDDQGLLAERLEDARHSQFASQGIAIWTDVAGEDEALMLADALNEPRPVDWIFNR
jgi:hypothetical protein